MSTLIPGLDEADTCRTKYRIQNFWGVPFWLKIGAGTLILPSPMDDAANGNDEKGALVELILLSPPLI